MSKTERVIALVAAQGFNAVVNFLFLPYFVRVLSREEYGLYGQVILVADTARTVFSLGMATVMYVSLARSKDKIGDFKTIFISSLAQGFLGFLAIFFSAGLFANWFHNQQLGTLLRIYSPYILFYIPYLCVNSLLIFLGRARQSLFIVSSGLLLRVILMVGAVQIFHSLSVVFLGLVLLAVVQLAMGLACVPRSYFRMTRFNTSHALERITLGAQLGFTEVMWFIIMYTDKFMIASLLSVEEFAIYRTATIELPVIGTLYTSIAAIVMPMVSKHYAEGNFDSIVKLKRKLITITAALIYPAIFFLIVFSRTLVTTYFSKKYAAGGVVFAIVSCSLFFRVNDYLDILISSGKGRLVMLTYLAAVVFNIIGNSILIRKFGYLGAAFSTLFTYGMLVSTLLLLSARTIKKSWLDFFDLPKLAIVVIVSASAPLAFYFSGFHTDKILFVLSYGAVSAIFAYFVFLKANVIEYRDISPIVRKVPALGVLVDRGLSQYFAT